MTSAERIKVAMTLSAAKTALRDLRGAGWQLTRRNIYNNVLQHGGEVFPDRKVINIAGRARNPLMSFFHEMGHFDEVHQPGYRPRGESVMQALDSELTANRFAAGRVQNDSRYLDYARNQYRRGYIVPLNAGAVADMKPDYFNQVGTVLGRWEQRNQPHPWDVAPIAKSIYRHAGKVDPQLGGLMRRHYAYSAPYTSLPGIGQPGLSKVAMLKVAMTLSAAKNGLRDLRSAGVQLVRKFPKVPDTAGHFSARRNELFVPHGNSPEFSVLRDRIPSASPLISFFHELGHFDAERSSEGPGLISQFRAQKILRTSSPAKDILRNELLANSNAMKRVQYDPRYVQYASEQIPIGYPKLMAGLGLQHIFHA